MWIVRHFARGPTTQLTYAITMSAKVRFKPLMPTVDMSMTRAPRPVLKRWTATARSFACILPLKRTTVIPDTLKAFGEVVSSRIVIRFLRELTDSISAAIIGNSCMTTIFLVPGLGVVGVAGYTGSPLWSYCTMSISSCFNP